MRTENRIYGCLVSPHERDTWRNPFAGTEPVALQARCPFRLYAGPNATLATHVCPRTGRRAHVWGRAFHEGVPEGRIPEFCLDLLSEGRTEDFRNLLGNYVVVLDDPGAGRVSLVSDIMGLRPFFYGFHGGRFVCGSEVWAIRDAGLADGALDYDTLATWLTFRHSATHGSLFRALSRLPPASVLTVEGEAVRVIPYATYRRDPAIVPPDQYAGMLHERLSAIMATTLADIGRFNLALSGGFDSRYLLALTVALGGREVTAVTVDARPMEGLVAAAVAETLGVPHRRIACPGSVWDHYEGPFHFTADGLVMSKHISYLIAAEAPGVPLMHGFAGDTLIRGSIRTFLGAYEDEIEGDVVERLVRRRRVLLLDLLRRPVAASVQARATRALRHLLADHLMIGKAAVGFLLLARVRNWWGNNVLQHLHLAEGLTPIMAHALIEPRMALDDRSFGWSNFEAVFQRFFPALAAIPHDTRVAGHGAGTAPRAGRYTRRVAGGLALALARSGRLAGVRRRALAEAAARGLLGQSAATQALMDLQRLLLLERRLAEAGLAIDWESFGPAP